MYYVNMLSHSVAFVYLQTACQRLQSKLLSKPLLVLLAVSADQVARREDAQEMRVQFTGSGGGEPARARQVGPHLLVHESVAPEAVLRREGFEEVIGNRLTCSFGESA